MVVLYFGMGSLHAHREPPSVINFPFSREGSRGSSRGAMSWHPNISKVIKYMNHGWIFFQKLLYLLVDTPNLNILLPSLRFFTRWQLVIWQTDHVGKPTLWLYSSSSAAAVARLPLRLAILLVSLDFCNSIEHSNSWKDSYFDKTSTYLHLT